jgi:hypothetical protein
VTGVVRQLGFTDYFFVYASAVYEHLLNATYEDEAAEQQLNIHRLFKSHPYLDAYLVPVAGPNPTSPSQPSAKPYSPT